MTENLNPHGDEHIEHVDIFPSSVLREFNARQGIQCPPEFIEKQLRVIAAARAFVAAHYTTPTTPNIIFYTQPPAPLFDELRAALKDFDTP